MFQATGQGLVLRELRVVSTAFSRPGDGGPAGGLKAV